MLADLLTHLTGKLVVDRMTRTRSHDATLDGLADQGHITDDIEQLVARTLIIPLQGLVLDVSQISSVAMLHVQHVGQHVEALLSGLALVDHDGIVQVAALDEVGLQQRLDVANEHERAGRGNLCIVSIGIIERSKLRADEFRLEGAHGCYREVFIGQDGDARTGVLILHLDLLADDIEVLGGVLLLDANLLDLLHILDGRAVEDGKLRAVNVDHTVVDTHRVEGGESVLYGRYTGIAFCQDCTTLGVNHILCYCVDDGLTFEVDTLDLVTRVLWSRIEGYGEIQSCMQAFSE